MNGVNPNPNGNEFRFSKGFAWVILEARITTLPERTPAILCSLSRLVEREIIS